MSAPWLSGGRIAARVLERQLSALLLHDRHDAGATAAMHRCVRIWRDAGEALGPASGATAVWMHLVAPCAGVLGWSPGPDTAAQLGGMPVRVADALIGSAPLTLVALPWGASQEGLRRACTRLGSGRCAAWVSVCNGSSWRWYDTARPFARDHLAIDLTAASVDARVWQALWLLGQPAGRSRRGVSTPAWIDRLVAASAAAASGTASALREGVASALDDLARHARGSRDEHVALIFQWLFLLFAESRQLVPAWHPAFRRSYAITTLAHGARRGGAAMPVGLHESVTAAGALWRRGGRLGDLHVGALNGPLFTATLGSPSGRRLPDSVMAGVLHRLTAEHVQGRVVDASELGVEHLGGIYEHLLGAPAQQGPALQRKGTGAYYTPTALADLLVQRTLDPLVRGASAEQILALRVLDPAMGSGALLAAALRHLVSAVEAAWVREGRGGPLDVSRHEREALPRRIAEQCLFGMDVNAHAVQVARLSIWLLSLAPDRPLTWLDAHLRVGNSLIGTSPATILARAPVRGRGGRQPAHGQLPLFDLQHWHHEAARLGPQRAAVAARPTDSVDDVRTKSRLHDALRAEDVLVAWRTRADAWCGAAMDATPEPAAVWRSVDAAIRAGTATTGHLDACRRRWTTSARTHDAVHWPLEFPDVFDGGRHGFDAVIANPPWEMLRGDLGTDDDRAARRGDIGPLLRFTRNSGLYRSLGGHVNSYQVFVERLLHLVRPGGRVGCLLPGSVLADHGAAPLRRLVLGNAALDHLSVIENREGLFPIHRSMRIVVMSGTAGAPTDGLLLDDGHQLRLRATTSPSVPTLVTRTLLRRATADAEAIPRLRDADEMALLERLIDWPRLGEGGWGLHFGRELNATDDRHLWQRPAHAGSATGDRRLPIAVVDGKHLHAFAVHRPVDGPTIGEDAARTVLPAEPWRVWRLAYRDVSSPTNTRSLIAALLPPHCVSTHTLFCLRTPTGLATQLYLCGMLNSLVADWFVRRYLGAHVTTKLAGVVPVPRVPPSDARRRRVVRLALRLMRSPADVEADAELQAAAASLYGLDGREREVVARDFARLPGEVRARMR